MKIKLLRSCFFLMMAFVLSCQIADAQSQQYLHFDRVDDHVVLEGATQYITNKTAFSMSGWFYTDELAYGQGMMGWRNGVQDFYLIQLSNGILECRMRSTDGFFEYVAPQFSIVPQTWQHIAWVFTGSELQLFIDGDKKGSVAASGIMTDPNVTFAIGRSILSNLDFYFGGRIDEVALWDKALTEADLDDIMANEMTGTEPNLQLYYKFNQGFPGQDNTNITKLFSTIGQGERDADLVNFALTGTTSNFGGMLDPGFQSISFPVIENKLTTAAPFALNASASSNLPITFEIVSGPATLSGDMVTLTGDQGTVRVKASQSGDGTYDPAVDVINSFEVLDPALYVPTIDARSPYANVEYAVPELSPIQLNATAFIDYPELFSVESLTFEIDGSVIEPRDHGNGYYTGWWNPPAYGDYVLTIKSKNNYTGEGVETVNFSVVDPTEDKDILAIDKEWINTSKSVVEIDVELPCQVGAYDLLTADLIMTCPPGGCGEWDRVANIEAQNHNGEWIRIVRYITPYGTACSHFIDLSDFMSVLHGKTKFRVSCTTFDNGYEWSLNLKYERGEPQYKYSSVVKLWDGVYPFGDLANLQPTETLNIDIPGDAKAAKLKLISTGHGWGDNNTGNAAEFHRDVHHVWVDGEEKFEQDNWKVCNPHPQACSPQAGTWNFSRAGWCPGATADWFDYDMTEYLSEESVEMKYLFDENYADYCHPSNPGCSPVVCANCADGFNPELHVASNLIFYSNYYGLVNTKNPENVDVDFDLFPNPSNGQFNFVLKENLQQVNVKIVNNLGQIVKQFSGQDLIGLAYFMDMSGQAKGMYTLILESEKGLSSRKLLVQ